MNKCEYGGMNHTSNICAFGSLGSQRDVLMRWLLLTQRWLVFCGRGKVCLTRVRRPIDFITSSCTSMSEISCSMWEEKCRERKIIVKRKEIFHVQCYKDKKHLAEKSFCFTLEWKRKSRSRSRENITIITVNSVNKLLVERKKKEVEIKQFSKTFFSYCASSISVLLFS